LVRNNNAHPWMECSNRGECDRDTGYVIVCVFFSIVCISFTILSSIFFSECHCDPAFEGIACQRLKCFNVSPFIES
jgi:dolichyl-phosphate-mannose--protein O-mannosyl transferase